MTTPETETLAERLADDALDLAHEAVEAIKAALLDPNVIYLNLLRGVIGRPTPEQMAHVYAGDLLTKAQAEAMVREEREACAKVADDEEDALPNWGEHRNAVVADQTKRDIAAAIRARTEGE